MSYSFLVALELLRQRRSIVAASTSYTHYRDGDKAQREFNTIAVRERSKFERETLNRYGGVDYASIPTEREGGLVPGLYDIENAEDRSSIFENTVLYNIN